MTTTIGNIGSNWRGEAPATIDDLISMMETQPLEERWWPFAKNGDAGSGRVLFLGNFATVSFAFSLWSDEEEVCHRLTGAILRNVRRFHPHRLGPEPVIEEADGTLRWGSLVLGPNHAMRAIAKEA